MPHHHGGLSVTMAAEPAPCLVAEAESLYHSVRRLHRTNESVLFWNEQRSFKLMLRNDPVDADTVSCELAMVVDEDDDDMARLMDLMTDGYLEEPGTFVLDSWTFKDKEFTEEGARKIQFAINAAHRYRVCPCAAYVIKDDGAVCVFCQMTRTRADKESHFCAICCEDGMRMHMTRQDCCQHYLHKHCMATWRSKSGDERCPLCRQ